jgi:hypothetical protein
MVEIDRFVKFIESGKEIEVDVQKEGLKIFSSVIPNTYKIHGFFKNGLCEND